MAVDEQEFREFLHLLVYYMCPRCDVMTYKWHPKHPDISAENHLNVCHHTGELIDAFTGKHSWTPCDIIEATYRVYRDSNDKRVDFQNQFSLCLNEAVPKRSGEPFFLGLRSLIEHRGDIFLKHGIERPRFANYTNGAIFPPEDSNQPYDLVAGKNIYAVDSDRVPFIGCTHHNIQGGIDVLQPWSYCSGYIPLRVFQAKGGVLKKIHQREHYYATSEIPLEDWIFIWDPVRLEQVLETGRQNFSKSAFRQNIFDLKNTSAPLIEFQTMRLFFCLFNLLEQKLDLAQLAEPI